MDTKKDADEVWAEIEAEFNSYSTKHSGMLMSPPIMMARFLFYAAILYNIGMDDSDIGEVMGIAKKCKAYTGDAPKKEWLN